MQNKNISPLSAVRRKQKILVVDDHPIVRHGLAKLIAQESDLEMCGYAEDVAEALRQTKDIHPALVVVDISLKASNGIELIGQIKAFDSHIKILVWSMFDEMLYAERALRAGAEGYVNKQEPIEKVLEAIHCVLQGDVFLSSHMTTRLLRRFDDLPSSSQDPIKTLSNRELSVLQMIGEGLTTQQIARRLKLSIKTVESYRENIKKKLDLKNSMELNRRAFQLVLEKH
jgi:DNA-binding NarL/FixJ family response regulator